MVLVGSYLTLIDQVPENAFTNFCISGPGWGMVMTGVWDVDDCWPGVFAGGLADFFFACCPVAAETHIASARNKRKGIDLIQPPERQDLWRLTLRLSRRPTVSFGFSQNRSRAAVELQAVVRPLA
jgi:hypothetical protein